MAPSDQLTLPSWHLLTSEGYWMSTVAAPSVGTLLPAGVADKELVGNGAHLRQALQASDLTCQLAAQYAMTLVSWCSYGGECKQYKQEGDTCRTTFRRYLLGIISG